MDRAKRNGGIFVGKMPPSVMDVDIGVAYCRTMVPGRTSWGALTLVLGNVVEALRVTVFLLLSTGKVAT